MKSFKYELNLFFVSYLLLGIASEDLVVAVSLDEEVEPKEFLTQEIKPFIPNFASVPQYNFNANYKPGLPGIQYNQYIKPYQPAPPPATIYKPIQIYKQPEQRKIKKIKFVKFMKKKKKKKYKHLKKYLKNCGYPNHFKFKTSHHDDDDGNQYDTIKIGFMDGSSGHQYLRRNDTGNVTITDDKSIIEEDLEDDDEDDDEDDPDDGIELRDVTIPYKRLPPPHPYFRNMPGYPIPRPFFPPNPPPPPGIFPPGVIPPNPPPPPGIFPPGIIPPNGLPPPRLPPPPVPQFRKIPPMPLPGLRPQLGPQPLINQTPNFRFTNIPPRRPLIIHQNFMKPLFRPHEYIPIETITTTAKPPIPVTKKVPIVRIRTIQGIYGQNSEYKTITNNTNLDDKANSTGNNLNFTIVEAVPSTTNTYDSLPSYYTDFSPSYTSFTNPSTFNTKYSQRDYTFVDHSTTYEPKLVKEPEEPVVTVTPSSVWEGLPIYAAESTTMPSIRRNTTRRQLLRRLDEEASDDWVPLEIKTPRVKKFASTAQVTSPSVEKQQVNSPPSTKYPSNININSNFETQHETSNPNRNFDIITAKYPADDMQTLNTQKPKPLLITKDNMHQFGYTKNMVFFNVADGIRNIEDIEITTRETQTK